MSENNNNNNNKIKDSDDNGLSLIKSETDKKCAPAYSFKDGSCIPLDALIKTAKEYNKNHEDKIKLDRNMEFMHPKKYKKYLVQSFNQKFPQCSNQLCWLDNLYKYDDKLKQKLVKKFHRPIGPQGKFTWLNTININDVMDQYTEKYDDFLFLGAVPMDFYEININDIKNLDYEDLYKNGIKKLGIVFNLDNHDQPGSHWVAGMINLEKGFLYYYDSYGVRAEKRVRFFFDKVAKIMQEKFKVSPTVDYNRKRHQYKDSECGMFSLYFIIKMLEGKDFKEVCNSKINDDDVNALRDKYFVLPKSSNKK